MSNLITRRFKKGTAIRTFVPIGQSSHAFKILSGQKVHVPGKFDRSHLILLRAADGAGPNDSSPGSKLYYAEHVSRVHFGSTTVSWGKLETNFGGGFHIGAEDGDVNVICFEVYYV